MTFPRVPKIEKIEEESWKPDEPFGALVRDALGLGPTTPWLRLENRFPEPDRLHRTDDAGDEHDMGDGPWRVHAYLSADVAVVSHDQVRLYELHRDGTERDLWTGPRIQLSHGGARWGGNWMFSASPLPDGRLVIRTPDVDDPDGDPHGWPLQVSLLDASRRIVASLTMPLRSPSAAKKKYLPRRFTAAQMDIACGGRVLVLEETEILAVGIYDDRLAFIGKGTMPRSGGGLYSDGELVRVSNDLSGVTYRYFRLEGLLELWQKKA